MLAQMIINAYKAFQYTSSNNHVLSMLFWKYLSKYLRFESNEIITSRFIEIPKKLLDLLNFLPIFWKKEHKTTKNTKHICDTFITTISSIIIELLFIINIKNFETIDKPKQHLDVINNKDMFLNITKNPSIVPIFSLWFNDNGIIWGVGLNCESESIDQGRSYVDKNINISLCFFSRYSLYDGNGGVVFVSISSCSMKINYSMFHNCVCSNYGGAICFYSTNSCLRMICANSCSALLGQFTWLEVSQTNQVEYLSVSNCSQTTSGSYSIRLFSGNHIVDNTNSSMNNAIQGSGIFVNSPSSFTSSLCSFSNNIASSSMCIYFSSSAGTISMSYANIVHNNSPSRGVVYVWGGGSRKMMYCIFWNNQNYLFCVYGGSLEVSHSFIDHSASFSTSTSVSTSTNNTLTHIITYQLQFFKSYYCNAQLPVPVPSPMRTETLAPTKMFEKSPIKSFEETIRRTNEETLRMTYEITINQTIRETIINTLNESPMNTQEQSPINTIDQTIRETQNETPYRSYAELICTNQIANWREISVVFSFAFLYPVIILMIS